MDGTPETMEVQGQQGMQANQGQQPEQGQQGGQGQQGEQGQQGQQNPAVPAMPEELETSVRDDASARAMLELMWPFAVIIIEIVMRQATGARGMEFTAEQLLVQFLSMTPATVDLVMGDILSTLQAHAQRMREDFQVGFASLLRAARNPTPQPQTHGEGSGGTGVKFKASLPKLDKFSGKGSTPIARLHNLAKNVASLAGLCMQEVVQWSLQFLIGNALAWLLGLQDRSTLRTFDVLMTAMAEALVGPHSFDLLVEDLQTKTIKSFTSFDAFKSWLLRTVNTMRVFASGRMWPDHVLVDRLIVMLMGTKYHEGVHKDPDTGFRPDTWLRALELLDARHTVLVNLGQAHGQVPLTADRAADFGYNPRKKPKLNPPTKNKNKPSGSSGAGPSSSGANQVHPDDSAFAQLKLGKDKERTLKWLARLCNEHGISAADMARRYNRQGHCLICEEQGHRPKDCPRKVAGG